MVFFGECFGEMFLIEECFILVKVVCYFDSCVLVINEDVFWIYLVISW